MSAESLEEYLRSLGGYENELLSIPAGGVRQLIAEYAAVERQLAALAADLETERRLSFRNQVAELERQLFATKFEVNRLRAELEK